MVDAGVVPVSPIWARDADRAGGGGADRRTGRNGNVDSLVHVAPAHAEPRDDRPVDRPDQTVPPRADRPGRQGPGAGGALLGDLLGDLGEVALEVVLLLADRDQRCVLL